MINLNDYKKDYYSQNGEDGILEQLYKHITPTGFVIEFGASDGLSLSNTAHLWRDGDSEALLIECDEKLYSLLEKNTRLYKNVTSKFAYVRNVDDWTTRVADVCSIDVDGADYQIAQRTMTPHQIVIIEYNPTVPPHVDMIGVEDRAFGSSAKSIVHMMQTKFYTLVAATKTNLFFLKGYHYDTFETSLEKLFDYSSLNYVTTSFLGEYDIIGEFGFGFRFPENMRLKGRDSDKRYTVDESTTEYFRRVAAMQEGKIS